MFALALFEPRTRVIGYIDLRIGSHSSSGDMIHKTLVWVLSEADPHASSEPRRLMAMDTSTSQVVVELDHRRMAQVACAVVISKEVSPGALQPTASMQREAEVGDLLVMVRRSESVLRFLKVGGLNVLGREKHPRDLIQGSGNVVDAFQTRVSNDSLDRRPKSRRDLGKYLLTDSPSMVDVSTGIVWR